jgi:hypothetical protein
MEDGDQMDQAPEAIDPESTDPLVREEEQAAAAEAARIGGRSGMEGMDEAERATAEHGGGQAEGFEESEKLLEDHATHGDALVDPLRDAGQPEAERDGAVYGEPDDVHSTETTDEDPQSTAHEPPAAPDE